MPRDLVFEIGAYVEMIDHLLDYRAREELEEMFIRRELVENRLRDGEVAPIEDLRRLEAADACLLRHHRTLVRRFRDLFELRPADIPRMYWWWYLDEGPRVREEAAAAANA